MNTISTYAKTQYEEVRWSRLALLDYCNTISAEAFVAENTAFGNGGSIRNLLVHVANTYEGWIARMLLDKIMPFSDSKDFLTCADVARLFESVDAFMFEFIATMQDADTPVEFTSHRGVQTSASPFKIFTHVITHEYHHKGQILTLSRLLGYEPVDTDVMR